MVDADLRLTRLRNSRLRRFITVLACGLWGLLVLERFGAAGFRVFAQAADAASLRAFGAQMVAAIPEVLYLLALDGVRRALGDFARGELFAPTVATMLGRVGVRLAAGAAIGVFVAPAIERALGAGPAYWIGFDVAGLVLGALGLSLVIIARVFAHAATMQAELDGIF